MRFLSLSPFKTFGSENKSRKRRRRKDDWESSELWWQRVKREKNRKAEETEWKEVDTNTILDEEERFVSSFPDSNTNYVEFAWRGRTQLNSASFSVLSLFLTFSLLAFSTRIVFPAFDLLVSESNQKGERQSKATAGTFGWEGKERIRIEEKQAATVRERKKIHPLGRLLLHTIFFLSPCPLCPLEWKMEQPFHPVLLTWESQGTIDGESKNQNTFPWIISMQWTSKGKGRLKEKSRNIKGNLDHL